MKRDENMSFWKKFGDFLKGTSDQKDDPTVVVVTNDENVPSQKPRVDKMYDLSTILQPENVATQVKASSKNEVLKYLADLAQKNDADLDAESVYGKLLLREQSCPTDIGDDIALPHIQDESLKELTMLVIKLNESVKWNHHRPVNIVIALLGPDPEPDYQHVRYLSTIARLLMKHDFLKELRKATTKAEIVQLFKK